MRTTLPGTRSYPRSRRILGTPTAPRMFRRLVLESLEDRTLLASATLAISATGVLTYVASTGATNNLTVSYTSPNYTFTDTGEAIALGSGTTGWLASGSHSVTGPGTSVKSISIDTRDGNDTVAIMSVAAPTNVAFTNLPGNADTVVLGGASNGAQGIAANVTISNAAGSTALTVDDIGDTKPQTVFLSDGQIANVEPYLIAFGSANLSSLSIEGSTALGTLNVNANDQGPVSVTGGSATGSGTIAIGSDTPINYSNFLAVNVSNAADQPLTQVDQAIVTTTADVPTEGKSFTFYTTTFADADLQSKTTSFVATINWGDGTAPVVGSISADGLGQFQVSGSHTYMFAGTYPVVTTINDLGTTDSLSVAGIAVTISDLGGGGLTTGSVARVNLVSNTSSIPADATDPNLVNAWGIAGDADGHAWVADEGSGVATYEGPGGPLPEGATVVIPPASGNGTGSPAGIVYNNTSAFAIGGQPSAFLYSTLDGTISGWDGLFPNSGPPVAVIAVNHSASGAVYTGLAIASDGGQELLYAANFHSGEVEVYNGSFQLVNQFTDPNLPAGFAPYNVANIGGDLYVSFAKQDRTGTTAVSQLGDGFVDVFSPGGAVLHQLIMRAPLDAPWGMALAPSSFGQFAGDLLVANQGDGQVDAFNPANGQFLGAFPDSSGAVISIDGLHGLFFGPGGSLYFTAGPDGGANGLFGSLSPTPPSVVIAPATLSATISNVSAVEGLAFDGVVATFTDANIYAAPGDFTATVQWGDGSSDTSGDGNVTITQSNGPGSGFIVTGTHVYTTPTTGFPPGILIVTIDETDGGSTTFNSVYARGTATVADAPLYAYDQDQDLVADGFFDQVQEGDQGSGIVAQFTDADPLTWPDTDEFNGPFAPVITWGDGKTSLGTVQADGTAGVFDVYGTHTYTSPTAIGVPDTVSVAVTDQWGSKVTVTNYIPVADGDIDLSGFPDLSENDATPIQEGKSWSGDVATFDFSNPNAVAGSFEATIDWGDGSPTDAATIKQDGDGTFHVSGTHTYLEGDNDGPGPYTITVTVLEPIGLTTTGTFNQAVTTSTAVVYDSPIQYTPPNATVTKDVTGATIMDGEDFTIAMGTMVDSNPNSTLSDFVPTVYDADNDLLSQGIVINWGDGTPIDDTTGTLVQTTLTPANAGIIGTNYAVFGSHDYDDPGNYQVTVTIGDSDDARTVGTFSITVGTPPAPPAPPVVIVNLTAIAVAVNVSVRQSFTAVVASFSALNLNVNLGTCCCCCSYFSALIINGDGTTSPGTIQQGANDSSGNPTFYVTDTHTYATPGTYDLTIEVSTPGNAPITASGSSSVNVYSSSSLIAQPSPIAGEQGTQLPTNTVVATFTDPEPIPDPSAYAAATQVTVNWGDGDSDTTGDPDLMVVPVSGLGTNGGTSFEVIDTHLYQIVNDVFLAYQVSVTIQTPDGAAAVTSLAYLNPPVLTTQIDDVAAVAGNTLTLPVASVHAAAGTAPAPDVAAKILWGDGDASDGVLEQGPGGTTEIVGTHTYATPGNYPIQIILTDSQGQTATDAMTADVTAPPVTVSDLQALGGSKASTRQLVITFSGPLDVQDAGRSSIYHLTAAGKGGSFTAHGARAIRIRSAVYDAADNQVTLTLKRPISARKAVQLRVDGAGSTGLEDDLGRLVATGDSARTRRDAVVVDDGGRSPGHTPASRSSAGRDVHSDAVGVRHPGAGLFNRPAFRTRALRGSRDGV